MLSETYRNWIQANQWMMWVSLIGTFVFLGLTFWKRKSYPMNLAFLAGFTAMEAYSISVIVSFYESKIVLTALVFTLGIFVALSLFACQSKYDFTHWAPYLFGAVWIVILFGFMAAFFPYNSKVELGYGIVTALIFSGYILVDTQLIMRHYHVEEEIAAHELVAAGIISGNRNFDGRLNASIRGTFLASPPMVVAYAVAGSILHDLTREKLGEDADGARLLFVTHSIPVAMASAAGPEPRGAHGAYVDWHLAVAAEVTRQAAEHRGRPYEHELVYCSRSGPPQQPWLEPDVNARLRELGSTGKSFQ